jgi:hypothetical protein
MEIEATGSKNASLSPERGKAAASPEERREIAPARKPPENVKKIGPTFE